MTFKQYYKLTEDARNEPMVIEEGVKEIMLGVLCALGISCTSMMRTPPNIGSPWGPTKSWMPSPKAVKRSPEPHVMTSPKSVDPTTPAVPKQMNQAKPDETFRAAWKKFIEPHLFGSESKIKTPEEKKAITDLVQEEIKTVFTQNPKIRKRLVEITAQTDDTLNLFLLWGPEPEHGWPGWNEVMKKVESAIAQPK